MGGGWGLIAEAELNYNGDKATATRRCNHASLLLLMNKMAGRPTCSFLTATVGCRSLESNVGATAIHSESRVAPKVISDAFVRNNVSIQVLEFG